MGHQHPRPPQGAAEVGEPVRVHRERRLARYLESNAANIRRRHVAQKNPGSWFRTIDRIYPDLVGVPKLLIPDIAGSNEAPTTINSKLANGLAMAFEKRDFARMDALALEAYDLRSLPPFDFVDTRS